MSASIRALEVGRDDLRATRIVSGPLPSLGEGQVLLRIDRFGLTANNVTYGVTGDRIGYWGFFPGAAGWGRIPAWGFADVVAGGSEELPTGTRVFGFLPMATHLVVEPSRISPQGFTDGAPHRVRLPPLYNSYRRTDQDPRSTPEREALHAIFYPLFATSIVIDDFLADRDDFGAERIVLSSASSKTTLGTARSIAGRAGKRPTVVGLTSHSHVGFAQGLGCYDEVVEYGAVTSLDPGPATVYVDVAGNAEVRRRIHTHLGDGLVASYLVGVTHWEEGAPPADLPGPPPTMFFAPAQIGKRVAEWGAAEYQRRVEVSLAHLLETVAGSFDVVAVRGLDGLRDTWLRLVNGAVDPATAAVVELSG